MASICSGYDVCGPDVLRASERESRQMTKFVVDVIQSGLQTHNNCSIESITAWSRRTRNSNMSMRRRRNFYDFYVYLKTVSRLVRRESRNEISLFPPFELPFMCRNENISSLCALECPTGCRELSRRSDVKGFFRIWFAFFAFS